MDPNTRYYQTAILPSVICRLSIIARIITPAFFIEIHKVILRFKWKCQVPRIAKAIVEEHNWRVHTIEF